MMTAFSRRLLPLLAFLTGTAFAGPEDVIRARLKVALPDVDITTITLSPLPGIYQVNSRNYEPVLTSADGRYLIQGELLEVQGSRIVNVSDQIMAAERKQALATLKPEQMVVFPAVGKPRSAIYVFTDVDCGYCRKFHAQVPELNRRGIEVRYLAFPRMGPGSVVAAKLSNVWCAPDRQKAMNQAKSGGSVAASAPACKSPVAAQYELGNRIGVRGTPAIFDVEGMQLGGYVPTDELARSLNVR